MKPIKVVMLGPYVSSFECGGVAVHINKLTEHLANRDDVILHLVTLGERDHMYKKDNLYIHEIKKIDPPIGSFSIIQINSLKRKIIEICPDLVHAQGTFVPYSTAAALIKNNFPTLLTVHGTALIDYKYHEGIKKFLSGLVQIPNERYVTSKISNLIVVAPQIKKLICSMTKSKIYMIPNGIDLQNIEDIKPKFVPGPSIFYIGRLQREKGVDILLNAIPIIREAYPTIRVYIAGSGPDESNLRKISKENNVNDCVEFLGYISENEKYSMFKSADLFVIPSRFDYGPIVLPEAMACGIAVVASDVGGIPFMIEDEHTGLLFESENEIELAKKVIRILENRDLRIKIIKASKDKISDFSWNNIAEQTMSVYRDIINES